MGAGTVNDLTGKKVKKRMGRPPLIPGRRRSAKLNVSFLPSEAKRFEAIAAKHDKTFSTWAREILLAAVRSGHAG
jgi:hypothetical protein